MGVDADGYGFSDDYRTIERLVDDVRVLSPAGIERVAAAWDRCLLEDGLDTFNAAAREALQALDQAGRKQAWDEIRRYLFSLTESGHALVAWQWGHGHTGAKAEKAVKAAGLGLLVADVVGRGTVETLVRPMSEVLPWLLPDPWSPEPKAPQPAQSVARK